MLDADMDLPFRRLRGRKPAQSGPIGKLHPAPASEAGQGSSKGQGSSQGKDTDRRADSWQGAGGEVSAPQVLKQLTEKLAKEGSWGR